jgi:hypothetical protein
MIYRDEMPATPINSDGDLHQALRQFVETNQIAYESIDEAAGFTARYASKLLAPKQIRRFSSMSRWALLGALGLRLVLEVDPDQATRCTSKLSTRRIKVPPQSVLRCNGRHAGKPNLVSLRFLRRIGKKGGKAYAKVDAKTKRRVALAGARARWSKRRQGKVAAA